MSHTQSDWKLEYDGMAICVGDQTLARIYYGEGRSKEESDANASLMAASPKLLAACREAMTALVDAAKIGGYGEKFILGAAYAQCRAAIEEATRPG